MKALVLKEYLKLNYEDVPTPEPAAAEVLVAVKACGICGSDVHGMDGSTGRRRPPIIMGHEAAGVIEAAGPGGNGWKKGDRVTFDSTVFCGACEFCRRGEINLCDQRRVLGVSCEDYRRHGAFADYVAVPCHILHRVPATLPFEHAALIEPFAIAFHALHRSPVTLNDTAVVVGCGMIGLAVIQAARLAGFGRIVAVDVAPEKLSLAARLGATDIVDSRAAPLEEILRLTRGIGADRVFEAVGITATIDLAIRCARKGGAVTLIGNVAPKTDLPLQTVVTRELNLQGSCGSAGEYPACIEMMARGAIDPASLLSAVAPLAEGAAWFDRLYRKEPGLLKVILKP
jgi:threonine dehydrogenase-like Zn-dependent dehydrogenase